MNDALIATFGTILVALIMSIPGSLAYIKQWNKDKAEKEKIEAEAGKEEALATEKIQEAALKMMDIYKREFEALKEKIKSLEHRVKDLEDSLEIEMKEKETILIGAWKLHDQVKSLNGTPYYIPPHKEK